MTAPGFVSPSRPGWWVKHGGDAVIGTTVNAVVTVGLTAIGVVGIDNYPPLRIPNRYVGPMAMRNAFRRATPLAAIPPGSIIIDGGTAASTGTEGTVDGGTAASTGTQGVIDGGGA